MSLKRLDSPRGNASPRLESAVTALEGDVTALQSAPPSHAASHQDGGGDEIATLTAAAGAIPKADANGQIPYGWSPGASDADFHKVGATGYAAYYYLGSTSGVALGTKALVANRAYAVAYIAPRRGGTIDQIQVRVTTGVAATNIRCGIYESLGETDIRPGALLADFGTGSSATTNTTITFSGTAALIPGKLYWISLLSDGAPTIRGGSANAGIPVLGRSGPTVTAMNSHLYAAATYASGLPNPFPTSVTAATGNFPSGFARYSV